MLIGLYRFSQALVYLTDNTVEISCIQSNLNHQKMGELCSEELALIYSMVILEMQMQAAIAVIGMPITQKVVVVTAVMGTLLILQII